MRTVKVLAAGGLVALALLASACSAGTGSGGAGSPGGGSAASTAEELRIRFDRQLGEHAILTVAALQDLVNQQATAAPESALLVGKNADDLGATFGEVFGASNGNQFKEQLKNQLGALVRYTVAKGAGDQPAAASALRALAADQARFVTFMGAAVPSLPARAVAADLRQRLHDVILAVNASIARDQPQAASRFAAVYEHMFTTGAALAGAAAPARDATQRGGALSVQPDDLRATLDMQLGEQAALTTLVLAKAVTGAPDGKAFGAQLAKSTQALTQTVASIYGRPAGAKFKALWNRQLAALLNYTAGKATHDATKMKRARAELATFSDELAAFLAGANPNLSRSQLSGLLQAQRNRVLAAVDATYARNAVTATSDLVVAYEQAFALGDTLAAAIAKQFPDRFAAGH